MSKTYLTRDTSRRAVDEVSLSVLPGEIFGVIGESGAGKSTLIRLINLLERPTRGDVLIDGESLLGLSTSELRARRRSIGMIFQHFNLLASRTALENVAFPLRLDRHLKAREANARAAALLERVGISALAGKRPSTLSGGEKQRVGLARALACNPSILLCDEATSALDPETGAQVLDLLADINRELGLTIVFVTHEMDAVRRICDRVAIMEAGRVIESGEVMDVFLEPREPLTRRLLRQDTIPSPRPDARTVRLICRGAVARSPFIGRIAQETGLDISILSGQVSEIKGEPYGHLIVSLTGGETATALAKFEAAGVRVREVTP